MKNLSTQDFTEYYNTIDKAINHTLEVALSDELTDVGKVEFSGTIHQLNEIRSVLRQIETQNKN